jgi:hypothetical protein
MKNLLLPLLLLFFCQTAGLAQNEEEKRAIIAAKNKIQSDSLSLHSRSMRVQECKKQNEQLIIALDNSYKTIGLFEEVTKTLRTDLEVCSDSLSVSQTQLGIVTDEKSKEQNKKKGWRKAFFVSLGVVAIETAILVIL